MRSIAMVAACPFPAAYGSSASIRELSKILGERSYRVHVVTYPIGDESLPVGDARIWRTPYWRKEGRAYTGPAWEKFILDLLMIIKLIRVIRRENIDVIHAHNYEGVLIGTIAKFFTGRPLIYQAVNLMTDELPSYNFIRPAFVARTLAAMLDWMVPLFPDFVIVISTELRDYFAARGFGPNRMALIPPGIYPEMFAHSNRNRFREEYSLGARKLVMYAGVSNAFQRIDYLLKAFQAVVHEEPDAALMVVSPLTEESDLPKTQTLAKELGIAENVIWVESQALADLPDYLAAADVTVIPRPDIPGYPLKLLNYMAAGRPVVCFEGAAKGMRHLHEAFVVKDHDIDGLGRGILAVLHDSDFAARMARNARELVLSEFDWEVLCTRIEGVYLNVLKAPPRAEVSEQPARVAPGAQAAAARRSLPASPAVIDPS